MALILPWNESLHQTRHATVAHDLDLSDQTVYNWRRQDRIDRGDLPGLNTAEKAELVKASKRIAELATELEVSRLAIEELKGAASPKGGTRRSR